jgi:hypothetical protein
MFGVGVGENECSRGLSPLNQTSFFLLPHGSHTLTKSLRLLSQRENAVQHSSMQDGRSGRETETRSIQDGEQRKKREGEGEWMYKWVRVGESG